MTKKKRPSLDEPLSPKKTVIKSVRLGEDILALADTCADVLALGNRTAFIELAALEHAIELLAPRDDDTRRHQPLPELRQLPTSEAYNAALELYVATLDSMVIRIKADVRYHVSPKVIEAVEQRGTAVISALIPLETPRGLRE